MIQKQGAKRCKFLEVVYCFTDSLESLLTKTQLEPKGPTLSPYLRPFTSIPKTGSAIQLAHTPFGFAALGGGNAFCHLLAHRVSVSLFGEEA
jgi:hypothetical protein